MLSFFLQNFGCRVNQAEGFAWAETLQAAGLGLAEDWRGADVIIVNTCTLTGRADRDVNRFLRRVVRESPDTRLAITGCASERLPDEIIGSPQIILTVPNADKEGLAARLLSLLREGCLPAPDVEVAGEEGHREPSRAQARDAPLSHVVLLAAPALDSGQGRSRGGETEDGRLDGEGAYPYRARAYLKIQDGCDNHCTFCVIPGVRGACRSVPEDDVVARIKSLTANGFREIVLAGIHLSSYGEDLGANPAGSENSGWQGSFTLTDLLQRIEKVPRLGRLRLSSLDPRKLDEAFIRYVAGNPRICQHFHLSLQHASAGILRKMGRLGPPDRSQSVGLGKTRAIGDSKILLRYETLLERLRSLSPEAAIGADIIVGFPGETEADFETLETFLERSPLSNFHVFAYSPRRGTPAASWPQVPEAVKSARARRLRCLSAAKNLAFRRSFLGRELDAVVISAPGIPKSLPRDIDAAPGMPGLSAGSVTAKANARRDLNRKGNGDTGLLTGNYISVAVPNCPASRRDLVRVRITRVLPDRTEGVVV